GRGSGTQSLPDSWSETMIGSRPSLGKITAALSRQVRKRQSERVPRACSSERCKLRPSTQSGTRMQSKPACAAPSRTYRQRQSRSANEYPVHLISAGDSMLVLLHFPLVTMPRTQSDWRDRLFRPLARDYAAHATV